VRIAMMTAMIRMVRLRFVPGRVASLYLTSIHSVPLPDATPGRFQGPKINQMATVLATKFNPRPPKISLTPPYIFIKPGNNAHRIPPRAPAIKTIKITSDGSMAVLSNKRKAPTANTEPNTICPSMPMFHKPAVNVKSNPEVAMTSGTHEATTEVNFMVVPNAPIKMFLYASRGSALTSKSINDVKTNARTTAERRMPKSSKPIFRPLAGVFTAGVCDDIQ